MLATPAGGKREVNEMRLRSVSVGLATLLLATAFATGCGPSKEQKDMTARAEAAATRAEDAARRAEAAASRVEAAAQRAEAAAEKAERMFSKQVRK